MAYRGRTRDRVEWEGIHAKLGRRQARREEMAIKVKRVQIARNGECVQLHKGVLIHDFILYEAKWNLLNSANKL